MFLPVSHSRFSLAHSIADLTYYSALGPRQQQGDLFARYARWRGSRISSL